MTVCSCVSAAASAVRGTRCDAPLCRVYVVPTTVPPPAPCLVHSGAGTEHTAVPCRDNMDALRGLLTVHTATLGPHMLRAHEVINQVKIQQPTYGCGWGGVPHGGPLS